MPLILSINIQRTIIKLSNISVKSATKKKGLPIPRKPRTKIVNKDRYRFAWDTDDKTSQSEPPAPVSDAARNHIPNPYQYSKLVHEKIAAVRAKSTIEYDANIDYAQDPTLY